MVLNLLYIPKLHITHYYHDLIGIEKSKIKPKILKTEGLVKNKICIYEMYKNIVMPHGHHIYSKASDMESATMCKYPHSDHGLPHWERVLQCCAKCRVLIFLTKKQMISIRTQPLHFDFSFII